MAIKDRLTELRKRHPALDRVLRTQEHYGGVDGSQQAGAATYFGFLSVFPILALAVFVVGYLARVYPDAQEDLTAAIDAVLPGLIGDDEGQLSLDSVERASGWAATIGVLGGLYTGLGWLSSLRYALTVVFVRPARTKPNFVVGKLRDLAALVLLGVVLMVAVAITGTARGLSNQILDLLGLGHELGWLVGVVSIVLGLGANAVLFFALFHLPPGPHLPSRPLWQGAALGAVGFELLKLLSGELLAATRSQPAAQAFGIALILLVWINYFTRVVLYAAAFAYVAPASRAWLEAQRVDEAPHVQGPALPPGGLAAPELPAGHPHRPRGGALATLGAGVVLVAVALRLRHRPH